MKIIVNTSSMIPIYEQIIDQIKTLIRKGELKENDCLPSVRPLSKDLQISALTVKKAYDTLESEGFTVTVHGKGTYVAAIDTGFFTEQAVRYGLPMDKKTKEFSAGMKAKLKVLIAISHRAKLLILDEPTAGLDVVARDELLLMLRAQHRQVRQWRCWRHCFLFG